MKLRYGTLEIGGIYHVFNRGVDKRPIFFDDEDMSLFIKYLEKFQRRRNKDGTKIVEIHGVSLINNHFHLMLTQLVENGVGDYIRDVCSRYARHFNDKYGREGYLFVNSFKYIRLHSRTNQKRYFVYTNYNNRIHGIKNEQSCVFRGNMPKQYHFEIDSMQENLFRENTFQNEKERIILEFMEARETDDKELLEV